MGLWGGFALVHFMCSYLEVDLGDMRARNQIQDVIDGDGALLVHLPNAKSPLHYLADSTTLIFLSEMRNGIPHQNLTAWDSACTILTPKECYEPGINQKIAIRELGGRSF